MLENIGRIAARLADYTIGTVIVVIHLSVAERTTRRRKLLASS